MIRMRDPCGKCRTKPAVLCTDCGRLMAQVAAASAGAELDANVAKRALEAEGVQALEGLNSVADALLERVALLRDGDQVRNVVAHALNTASKMGVAMGQVEGLEEAAALACSGCREELAVFREGDLVFHKDTAPGAAGGMPWRPRRCSAQAILENLAATAGLTIPERGADE